MSSTTDRHDARGQILPLFAGGLIAILAIAALVFDVGMNMFERRQYQNSSDAAALAGARYLTEAGCFNTPSLANCANAVTAAVNLATTNTAGPGGSASSLGSGRYTLADSSGSAVATLQINVPPVTGNFRGQKGYIQTNISSTRPSFFSGVLGMIGWQIGAGAVASNVDNYALPYSFLALDDSNHCKTGQIGGNGTVTLGGDVMVNSSCNTPAYALAEDGTSASISAATCAANGTIDPLVHCTTVVPGSPQIADPLLSLPAPVPGSSVVPNPPTAPVLISGSVATGPSAFQPCPGGSGGGDATEDVPKTCVIRATSAGTAVRIYPGVYWGGLQLDTNGSGVLTVYMEPGIYYMAGGGFSVVGARVTLLTVASGGTTFTPYTTGGVMIYNDDVPKFRAACVAGTAGGTKCIGALNFQNTTAIKLNPYTGTIWTNMLMFQARDASLQRAVSVSGNTSNEFYGTIYVPGATFTYTGNGSGEVFGAQVISWDFAVSGNGSLTVTYDPNHAVRIKNVGLVQ